MQKIGKFQQSVCSFFLVKKLTRRKNEISSYKEFFHLNEWSSIVLFLRQFQGIYEEKPVGLFPGLLEPTLSWKLEEKRE